jgi:hypothetical protein
MHRWFSGREVLLAPPPAAYVITRGVATFSKDTNNHVRRFSGLLPFQMQFSIRTLAWVKWVLQRLILEV